MTWSVAAHDPGTGAFALAVATCAFGVGANCPFVRSGVGAVCTQSITNRYLGPAVLDAMERGLPPADAIEGALAGDAGRGIRQVHAVDRHGRAAAHTGANCVEWCGDLAGAHVSIAGNMLVGPAVVAETLARFEAEAALPLPERLLAAMDAGQAAGGDKRGDQSAALVLTTTEDFPDMDIRVDDHAAPLAELRRLLALWRRDREPRLRTGPRKADPSGLVDLDAIEAGWRARGFALRFRR
jgi:uncharacterized Ntn-hydrolase superfamily protein